MKIFNLVLAPFLVLCSVSISGISAQNGNVGSFLTGFLVGRLTGGNNNNNGGLFGGGGRGFGGGRGRGRGRGGGRGFGRGRGGGGGGRGVRRLLRNILGKREAIEDPTQEWFLQVRND